MFHYIKGKIAMKYESGVVVDVGGIGYEIAVPDNSSVYLKESGEDVLLYTVMAVREDDISLYGFSEKEALTLFKKLTTVNGVGAKAGMALLSALPITELTKAILFEDVASLTKANGIGKKIAQRIVLELKDKVDSLPGLQDTVAISAPQGNSQMEAADGLMALGYSKSEAMELLVGIKGENLTAEDYIKKALRNSAR